MTVRLEEREKALIDGYARTFGVSISEFVRGSVLDRIEDELDIVAWREAKAEFDADPITVTADEVASKYL